LSNGAGNATQTITGNTFSNWTGGAAAVMGMSMDLEEPLLFQIILFQLYRDKGYYSGNYAATSHSTVISSYGTILVTRFLDTITSSLSINTASVHGVLVITAASLQILQIILFILCRLREQLIINGISAATLN
jgi:hypothetical protein